MRQILNIL